MGPLDDLAAVFVALGETLAEDGCPRAEVRLRAAFLDGRRGSVGGRGPHRPDATDEDDVAVWTWNAPDAPHLQASWWHVTLPFLDHDGRRFGSMVLWADGVGVGSPFPHFHAISGDLRGQIEAKLLTLWPIGADRRQVPAANVAAAAPAVAPPVANGASSGDRARGRDRVPTGSGPAVPIA